jgi:universal protein Kae1
MICLGVESTAHTFGIGIVTDKGEVLANVLDTYRPPEGWGIEPIKAAKHHEDVAEGLLQKALKAAKLSPEDIGLVAYSQGPGLPPCLHKGLSFSKELAKKLGVPLLGVNHCIAHIEIGKQLTEAKDPVTLYVSGANTQVIAFVGGKYRIFGETQDIGIGNALDKLGRDLGIGFPAGPKVEELAKKGKWIELPYVVKGMDLSFSGIVSEAARRKKAGASLGDICFSFQESAFAMLTEVTERAMAHTGKKEVLLTGGVAANSRLRQMLGIMAKERGAKSYVCPKEYCGDNGAMISWLGLVAHKAGVKEKEHEVKPRQRTDDVEVSWL